MVGAWPYTIATIVNRELYNYLSNGIWEYGFLSAQSNDYCYYGVVAMDYPGYYDDRVIDLIIKQSRHKWLLGHPIVTLYNTIYNHYTYASSLSSVPSWKWVFAWETGDLIRQAFWIQVDVDGGQYLFYNTAIKAFLFATSFIVDNRRQIGA